MNIKINKAIDLKEVDRNDVTLFFKPEIGEFDIGLKKDGKIYSICKLEKLNGGDIGYIAGGISYLNDKTKLFLSNL